jgi:hypothetical protein
VLWFTLSGEEIKLNRQLLAALFIVGLIGVIVAGMQTLEVAKANPVRLGWVPTTPDTNIPQLAIELPLNNKTYNTNEINFSSKIDLPESWFNNAPHGLNAPDGRYCNGKVLSAQILIDNEEVHNFLLSTDNFLPYSSSGLLNHSLALAANLSTSEGNHVLAVHLLGESYYSPNGNLTIVRYPISVSSAPVSFYVDTLPFSNSSFSPSPSQTLSPSPSATMNAANTPTQQPTLEPTQTSSPTPPINTGAPQNTDLVLLIAVGLIVLAVVVGAAVAIKVRNRRN